MADVSIPQHRTDGPHEWTDPVTQRRMGAYGSALDVVPQLRFLPQGGEPEVATKGPLGDLLVREILRLAAENEQLKRIGGFDRVGAERLADEVASLVARGLLDSRSAAADALLDYRDPPRTERSDRLAELEEEPARIRRELLAEIDPKLAALKARNKGAGVDPLTVHDSACIGLLSELRRAVDRICPAGPEEG